MWIREGRKINKEYGLWKEKQLVLGALRGLFFKEKEMKFNLVETTPMGMEEIEAKEVKELGKETKVEMEEFIILEIKER